MKGKKMLFMIGVIFSMAILYVKPNQVQAARNDESGNNQHEVSIGDSKSASEAVTLDANKDSSSPTKAPGKSNSGGGTDKTNSQDDQASNNNSNGQLNWILDDDTIMYDDLTTTSYDIVK